MLLIMPWDSDQSSRFGEDDIFFFGEKFQIRPKVNQEGFSAENNLLPVRLIDSIVECLMEARFYFSQTFAVLDSFLKLQKFNVFKDLKILEFFRTQVNNF